MAYIKNIFTRIVFAALLLLAIPSHALVTEVGLSYGFQEKKFNTTNYYQSDSKSASVSLYFWEFLALETSYTDSFYESHEDDGANPRVVQQSSKSIGADLIFMLADNQSRIQPYLKAGSAYITRDIKIKYENANATNIPTKDGWAPSYGAGIKVKLTERFSLKVSYDVWSTPMTDGSKSNDTSLKVGLSMFL